MNICVIITNQRTGGTSLTRHLSQFFDLSYQEPFNKGRIWEDVRISWRHNKTWPENFFKQFSHKKIILKQCVEIHAPQFNVELVSKLINLGARVIVLTRNSEQERTLSLKNALETGVWGPNSKNGFVDLNAAKNLKAKSHQTLATNRTILDAIDAAYQKMQINERLDVTYEELYSPLTCRKCLQNIHDHLSTEVLVTPRLAEEYLATGKTPRH